MGGVNIGELYAALKLDNSQYLQALDASGAASRLMMVDVNAIGGSVQKLDRELRAAGVNMRSVQSALNSLRAQGLDTSSAVEQITLAFERTTTQLQNYTLALRRAATEKYKLDNNVPALGDVSSRQTEIERAKALELIRILKLRDDEVVKLHSLQEAERIHIARIKERIKVEQDYKNLTAQIRAEADAADKRIRDAKSTAMEQNALRFGTMRADEQKYQQDMAKMRTQYTKEANAAQAAVDAAAAKAMADTRLKIESGATTRRIEIINAELAAQQAAYEREVAAAALAEKEKTAVARKGWLERFGLTSSDKQSINQVAYLAGGRFGGHASALTMLSPGAAAGAAVGLGLALATKEAMEFDKALTEATSNIKGFSEVSKKQLGDLALDLAAKFPFAAVEIAKAFKQMKESGYDAQQSLAFMPRFLTFATAHSEELGASIEHVTSVIKAFGMEGKTQAENLDNINRVMDLITSMNREGGASAVELAQSLSAVGQKASQLGMSVEQAAAAVTILNKQNIDGSRAGEVLTRFLIVVSSAFEKHTAQWREMGVVIHDANNNLKPFPELIAELAKVIGTNDPWLNSFNMNLLGLGTRSDKATAAFLKQVPALNELMKATQGVNGEVDKLAKTNLTPAITQFALLKNSVVSELIEIGDKIAWVLGQFAQLENWRRDKMGMGFLETAALVIPGVAQYQLGKKLFGGKGATTDTGSPLSNKPSNAVIDAVINYTNKVKEASDAEEQINAHELKWGNDLAILRKRLNEVNSELVDYDKLIHNKQVSSGVREGARETFEKLQAEKSELESRIAAVKSKFTAAQSNNFTEDLRQKFMAFSDEYGRALEKLSTQQQEIISSAAEKLGAMFADADVKGWTKERADVILNAYNDLEKQLKSFRADAAEKERQENVALAKQNAAQSVKAFREKYEADLRSFSDQERSIMESLISNMESMVKSDASPKVLLAELKAVEAQYKSITDVIDDTLKVQSRLNAASREWHAQQDDKVHQRPDVAGIETRIPAALLAKIEANRANSKNDEAIASILKGLGAGNNSQAALDLQANSARALYKELQTLDHTAHDEHVALVSMWESEAAAAHTAVESVSNAARIHYRAYKAEVQNSVIASNRAWKESLQEIGRGIRTLVSDFSRGLLDIVFPKNTDTKDKLAPLVTAFRDVYEQLSAYSDPKRALDGVIKAIQTAGTAAQANAIAVKYFGKEAGPNLARELRDGTLSAKDIAEAIDRATKSTLEYGEETAKSLSKISSLWHALVSDLLKLIVEQLIKLGFKALIGVIFDVSTAHKTLTEVIEEAWSKVWNKIKGVKDITEDVAKSAGAAAASIGAGVAGEAGTWIQDESGQWVNIGGDASKTGTGVANTASQTASSAGSGVMGLINVISGAITAVSSVIGNFQMFGMNKSLDIIVKHTLQTANDLANLRRDEWDRETHLMAKLDDMWKELREGTVFGQLRLIVSKLDEFIIPALNAMSMAMTTGNITTGHMLNPAMAGGGTSDNSFNITGPITVVTNKPEEFVRELKRRRITRGVR